MFKEAHATLRELEDHLEGIREQHVSASDTRRGNQARDMIGLLSDTFGIELALERSIKAPNHHLIAILKDAQVKVIADRTLDILRLAYMLFSPQTADSEVVVRKESNNHTMKLDHILSPQHSGSQDLRSEVMTPNSAIQTATTLYEKEMDDLAAFTDDQRATLEFSMGATARRERESARFLARFSWNLQVALDSYFLPGVHFEEDANSDEGYNAGSDDEGLAKAIQMSIEPLDDTPVVPPRESAPSPPDTSNGVNGTQQPSSPWLRNPPRPRPSRWRRDAESVDEATRLAADRRRLARIIG